MSLDGLNNPNSPQKIDHPNFTSFTEKQLSWMTYFKIILRNNFHILHIQTMIPWKKIETCHPT